VKPVYLLQGEDFLADEALAKVREEVGADPLSEVTLESSAAASEIIGALVTPSLLGGTRLVVVRDAGSLDKDKTEALADYLDSPSPDCVLVLTGTPKTKLATKVKKVGAVVSQDAPKGRRLVGFIQKRAKEKNLQLDERGAWALIDAIGNELRDLSSALDQLSLQLGRGTRVGQAEVRRTFSRLADERVYAFTDAVGERKLPVAMGTLRRLLEQGDEPLMIFGALSAHVRRMLAARRIAEKGVGAVAGFLGMPEWRADRLYKQMRSYREEELIAAMSVLAETDVEMKGGDLPPEIALEKAVIRIVSG
jgi:DNA polymerase III subunit delta